MERDYDEICLLFQTYHTIALCSFVIQITEMRDISLCSNNYDTNYILIMRRYERFVFAIYSCQNFKWGIIIFKLRNYGSSLLM
jgi:hypothetical protein